MDTYNELMRLFGKRMACLVISAVQQTGEHKGSQITKFYPGFIISVRGQWLFVTAGHSIRDLDRALSDGSTRITASRFVDCFSPDAKHQHPDSASFPFDYEGSRRQGFYFDEDADRREEDGEVLKPGDRDGRDFGFIKIDDHSKKLFEANEICPLNEDLWKPPEGTVLREHVLVGIPEELIKKADQDKLTTFSPENVCIVVNDPICSATELDTATHRRIVKEIPSNRPIKSVKGMSGGPLFAIGDGPVGEGRIWVVGIQSKEKGKCVFAYPFGSVVALIDEALKQEASGDVPATGCKLDDAPKASNPEKAKHIPEPTRPGDGHASS